MMAGTHCNSFRSKNRPHIVSMNVLKHKGHHTDFFLRGPDDSETVDAGQSGCRIGEQVILVRRDLLPIQSGQIIDRRCKPNSSRDVRGSGFKLIREYIVMSLLKSHQTDHVTAPLIRRHCVKQLRSTIEDSNPRRPEKLVPGKRIEVTAELLNIDFEMRNRLRSI